MDRGLLGSLGEQQTCGLERLADPPGRIEPRRERVRDRVEVHRGRFDLRALEQRRDAGPGRGSQSHQPEPRDGPVLPDDRGDVGDGADRREVREVERGRRATRLRRRAAAVPP